MATFNTSREFFNAVIAGETVTDTMKEYAKGEIAKMDAKNEKRRNTLNAKQKNNAELAETIFNGMEIGKGYKASDIVETFGVKSTQMAGALMKILVEDERVTTAKRVKSAPIEYTRNA